MMLPAAAAWPAMARSATSTKQRQTAQIHNSRRDRAPPPLRPIVTPLNPSQGMNRNVAVVYRETEALKTYKDCVVAQEQRLSRNVIARYMAFLKVHDHAPDTRVATS